MQIGVVFPQTEIGADVGGVRAYVEGVEQLGYRHVLAYDRVLGADPAVHAVWDAGASHRCTGGAAPTSLDGTQRHPRRRLRPRHWRRARAAPRAAAHPVWFGAFRPPGLRRAGRLGDGWFPMVDPGPRLDAAVAEVRRGAEAAGRDPSAIGMEGQLMWRGDGPALATLAHQWREAGATHLSVNTMGAGLEGPEGHLRALAEAAKALGLQ